MHEPTPRIPASRRSSPRAAQRSFPDNRLLAALDRRAHARLFDALEPVTLERDEVLHESGKAFSDAWFPLDAIVSFFHVLEDGASTDIALVGREGMTGFALLTGDGITPFRADVQLAGRALRLHGTVLRAEFERSRALRDLLLRHMHALFTQLAQNAVCNRHHAIEQQLCRWLLMTLDRIASRTVDMTQERIAMNLGVRREGITGAARRLQRQRIIDYSRGHITVLDRAALEVASCECYAIVRRETERVLAV